MLRFIHSEFPFLDKLKHRLLHVFIILVFSVLFLLIFEPFNIKAWLKYPEWLKDLGLISLALTFSFIIAFSQLLIRTVARVKTFKVYHLMAWLAAEILLLAVILTMIFADYSNGFLNEFFITLRFTSIGLVLPYSFSILILVLIHQKNKLERSNPGISGEKTDLIHLQDERGQVKFSIRKPSILYLESADNYVTIHYLQEGELKKEMVRNSMKRMDEQLSSYHLLRCHRSFMVNIENVHSVKKEGRNYQIKLKNTSTIIPVSRAYIPAIKSLMFD